MSITVASEYEVPITDSFIQQLDFCIVQDDSSHRTVIYVNHRLHGDTEGKTAHDETKFHRQHGKIVAGYGQINDQTARVVEALERFIWHPFDRYDGIRILSAFDSADYVSKIVIKLEKGHTATEVCYAIAKAMFRTCFRAHIQYADCDTLSELEAEDRRIDSPVPAYAMSY